MSECKGCGKLIATQEDWDTIPEGEGEHLCWSRGRCSPSVGTLLAEITRLRNHLLVDDVKQYSCGNSCVFGPPGGMATNGGCKCLDGLGAETRRRVRAAIYSLRSEVARLKEENEEWESRSHCHEEEAKQLSKEVARLKDELANLGTRKVGKK